MKKLLLCLVAIALAATTFAQNERVLGVRAGGNLNNMTFSDDGHKESGDSRFSFHAGFVYQQPLLRTLPLYLETGLYFTSRGSSITFEDNDKMKFNMYYLQVPVLLSWHFKINSVSIQPAVGAYYGYGIYGRVKYEGESIKLFSKEDGMDDPIFNSSDVGLRFGLGVTIKKHYFIGFNYDLGLMNIATNEFFDDMKIKNGSFMLSLGYNF